MIHPLTDEATWLQSLDSASPWVPPASPLLVLSPHPDDETLGCGGLIAMHRARGLAVTILAVTDGEHAYADTDPSALAATRRAEQSAAATQLGVPETSLLRLALTDSSVAQDEARLADLLQPHVTPETLILAPWTGDYHPDHEACGRAAQALARRTGATLLWYFFWTWHRGTPADLAGLSLLNLQLTSEARHAKASALAEHRSQLQHPSGEPILPANLLGPALRPFEVFATA